MAEELGTRAKLMIEKALGMPEVHSGPPPKPSPPMLIVKALIGETHTIEFITAQYTYEEVWQKLHRGAKENVIEAVDENGERVMVTVLPAEIKGDIILSYTSMVRTRQQQQAAEMQARRQASMDAGILGPRVVQ